MPPKKEVKEKQVKGDEAEELVLEYLKKVNRPYASTDVSANLKGKVNKATAQKVMQTLADAGKLTVKPYGKQTIYVYNQSSLPVASSDDLAGLDQDLKNIKAQVEERKKEHKQLASDLATTLASPPTREIGYSIKKLKAENEATLAALLPYRGEGEKGGVEPMSEAEMKKIDQDFSKWRKQWTDRRKVYRDLLGMLTEVGLVSDVRSMEEDCGIENDDDEAIEVDQGEFCKPSPIIRKPIVKNCASGPGISGGDKRQASTPSSQDTVPKKKAKKTKT